MSHLERRPYARDLGMFSTIALRAPFFAATAALFTVLAVVFTVLLVTSEREELGRGLAGQAFQVAAPSGNSEGKIVIGATGDGVDPESGDCTITTGDGSDKKVDVGLSSTSSFEQDGETWTPVAWLYGSDDARSVTCNGPGITALIASYNAQSRWWPLFIGMGVGAPLTWLFAGFAYILRRSAQR